MCKFPQWVRKPEVRKLFPYVTENIIPSDLPLWHPKQKRNLFQVCRVCALEKDFKQFPYADQTLVGERGVSLSGGQRARINLARAVYREVIDFLFLFLTTPCVQYFQFALYWIRHCYGKGSVRLDNLIFFCYLYLKQYHKGSKILNRLIKKNL